MLCLLLVFGCQERKDEGGRQMSPDMEATVEIGGGCDGCELMFTGMPENILAEDYSLGWKEGAQKLVVEGKVMKPDQTPASDVILYYWQTDSKGYYSQREDVPFGNTKHGHLRGWVKTDAQGQYTIHTNRPGPYPTLTMPAHVHFSVLEPGISNEYFIDDLLFDDDPLLTGAKRSTQKNRGGNGITEVRTVGEIQYARRDIELGLNISNYPR